MCTGEPHRGCVRAVIESAAENRTQFISDRDDPQGTVICQEVDQISVTSTSVRGSVDAAASSAAGNPSGTGLIVSLSLRSISCQLSKGDTVFKRRPYHPLRRHWFPCSRVLRWSPKRPHVQISDSANHRHSEVIVGRAGARFQSDGVEPTFDAEDVHVLGPFCCISLS